MTNKRFRQEATTDGLNSLGERRDGIHRMARSYNNLGVVYRKMGEWDRAIEMHRKSLAMYKRAGDARGVIRTHNDLGLLYEDKREWTRAKENYEKALEMLQQVGDDRGIASTLTNLAIVHLEMGRDDQAKHSLGRAYLICSELGSPHADSVLEALEEVCESEEAAEEYLAQLTGEFESSGRQAGGTGQREQ
jgi:tetratricopeptide (TPR) repeat protein